MPRKTQITLHHCIGAQALVFYSFGEGLEGGEFYDSLSLKDACHPLTLLADEMNYAPLGELYGAPLRLRVENQPGFKWIPAIEFVDSTRRIGKGERGYNEDEEFFGELANI